MRERSTRPFAVFAVVEVSEGFYAATTRAADRGEDGRIGLPGGKVDLGESPVQALVRECAEEGWMISDVHDVPCHAQDVDGKPVLWFRANEAYPIGDHKEKGRISPVVVNAHDVKTSGHGNENLQI